MREAVTAILHDTGNRLKRADASYRLADRVPELLGAMERLAATTDLPPTLPAGVEKLAAPVMATLLNKRGTEVGHPFFDLFGRCTTPSPVVAASRRSTCCTRRAAFSWPNSTGASGTGG